MTAPARLARVHELAAGLAAEVLAIAEDQTLAEHIRDRGEWSRLEIDARRLCMAIGKMVERARGDLFEGETPARKPSAAGEAA